MKIYVFFKRNVSQKCFYLLAAGLHIFCLKSLEGGDIDVSDQSVQFVGGVLILVTHTSQTNANPEGNIPAKEYKSKSRSR